VFKVSGQANVVVIFLIAIGILCLNAYYIYQSIDRMKNQAVWVADTQELIGGLEELVSYVKDVQSAPRGYVITGQKDYLSSYNSAIPDIKTTVARLDVFIPDDTQQQLRFSELRREIDKRLQISENLIEIYDEQGRDEAFAFVASGLGKMEMERIRNLAGDMISNEKNQLTIREHNLALAVDKTLANGLFAFALSVFTLIILFILIFMISIKRKRAEKEAEQALQDVNELLEENRLVGMLSEYLQSCQQLDEAYEIIEKHVPEILPNTSGAVYRMLNSKNLIRRTLSWGEHIPETENFQPRECWALRRGHEHKYSFGKTEPRCQHDTGGEVKTSLCIPMQAHGEIVGLLYVTSYGGGDLSQTKRQTAQRISEQISLATSNLELQETLREQSTKDPLTGLFNRRYFEDTFEREVARAERSEEPLSLLVLDIDHFKRYNDTMGHDTGDILLSHFAKILLGKTRKEDVAVRYGGEEFVFLMTRANTKLAEKRAKEISKAVKEMDITHKQESIGNVTVSIGVASYPEHGKTLADLLHVADKALYKAKADGRDRVVVAKK